MKCVYFEIWCALTDSVRTIKYAFLQFHFSHSFSFRFVCFFFGDRLLYALCPFVRSLINMKIIATRCVCWISNENNKWKNLKGETKFNRISEKKFGYALQNLQLFSCFFSSSSSFDYKIKFHSYSKPLWRTNHVRTIKSLWVINLLKLLVNRLADLKCEKSNRVGKYFFFYLASDL